MNSLSLLQPEPMRPHELSSRRVCIAPCMSASTRRLQITSKIRNWNNSCGSEYECILDVLFYLTLFFSPPAPTKVNPRRKVSKKSEVIPSSAAAPIVIDEDETSPPNRSQVNDSFMAHMTVLFEQEAELYFWDMEADGFRNDGIVMARITKQNNANYVYWLTASNDQGMILAHRITSDMNQRFSHRMRSLTWNYMGENNSQSSWLFRFAEEQDFASAVQVFTQCLWETLHQIPWGKAKVCIMFCMMFMKFKFTRDLG